MFFSQIWGEIRWQIMQMTMCIFQKIAQMDEDIRERNLSLERSSLKKSRRISSNFSRDFASSSSNSDEKHLIKKRKKKHKKRKFKKRRTKSFTPETNRFCVVNQEDQFKWELLNAMAEYANNHLNIFIQEQDLK